MVKESIINGEMVSKKTVDRLIETQLKLSINKKGVIIDGYPRDMEQVKYFQNKVRLMLMIFTCLFRLKNKLTLCFLLV